VFELLGFLGGRATCIATVLSSRSELWVATILDTIV
jgi:hypothetical protein